VNHLNFVVRAAVAVGCLYGSVQGRAEPTQLKGTNGPQAQAASSYTLHPTNSDRMALFWPTQKTLDMLCGTGDALQTFKVAIRDKGYIPRVPDEVQIKTEDDAEKYLADHKLPAAVFISVSLKSETNTTPPRAESPTKSETNAANAFTTVNNTVSNAQTTVTNAQKTVNGMVNLINNAKNLFSNIGKNESTENTAPPGESKEKPLSATAVTPPKGPVLPAKFDNIVTMGADLVNQDGDILWSAVVTTTNVANSSQTDFTEAIRTAASALAHAIPAPVGQK